MGSYDIARRGMVIQDFHAFHQRNSMVVKLVDVLSVERENCVVYMASTCPCKRGDPGSCGCTGESSQSASLTKPIGVAVL